MCFSKIEENSLVFNAFFEHLLSLCHHLCHHSPAFEFPSKCFCQSAISEIKISVKSVIYAKFICHFTQFLSKKKSAIKRCSLLKWNFYSIRKLSKYIELLALVLVQLIIVYRTHFNFIIYHEIHQSLQNVTLLEFCFFFLW